LDKLTKHNVIHLIFLELVSLTPILIILGNIVPPFPLKIHHIGFGLIFLISLYALLSNPFKKWILYIALIFTLIQFTHSQWHVKGLIDYFFGPFALILMFDILVNKKLPKDTLLKYERRFYKLLWIPIIISTLQFFGILPITFWNATYINYAFFGDIMIPRPNGFLYHGSELSILICFLALFQFFKKEQKAFWMLLLVILFGVMTYFKAVTGCLILIFLYYISFVNRGTLSKFRILSKKQIIAYMSLGLVFTSIIAFRYFSLIYQHTGDIFYSEMLTGRGAIWNIFLEKVSDFTWWNYLFGNGMGSSFDIFKDYATPITWPRLALKPNDTDYDTHNVLLSVFINSGIIGIAFFIFLFKMIFNQCKTWLISSKWNKIVFIGVIFIPLFTIGITIPIFENAIFWICLGFLLYRWKFYTEYETA